MILLDTITGAQMQTARMITFATMALWLGIGVAPGLGPYATRLRAILLAGYLLGCVGFVLFLLVWR